jgi:NAD-dependent deacetylase
MERSLEALNCDLFLAVGTSAVVYPAAGFIHEARARGAQTVEINPEATPFSTTVDLVLAARAEEVLPEVEGLLRAHEWTKSNHEGP